MALTPQVTTNASPPIPVLYFLQDGALMRHFLVPDVGPVPQGPFPLPNTFPMSPPPLAVQTMAPQPLLLPPAGARPPEFPVQSSVPRPFISGGRLRHGNNVHVDLVGLLRFVPYATDVATVGTAGDQSVVRFFFQMYPAELSWCRAAIVSRLLDSTLGPQCASVVQCDALSDTSFIAQIATGLVWHVIHSLRSRVLMDRHGFWYAQDEAQYHKLREYTERVRTLPDSERHRRMDGLPWMPLIVELARGVDSRKIVAPRAPPPFDLYSGRRKQGRAE